MEGPIRQQLVPIKSVWDRMDRVEERLMEVTVAQTPFLTEIAQHLLKAGGKRFRPLLAQVAGEFGTLEAPTIEAGVSVELVHAGSLYHDDVIDEAKSRHGETSANLNWSNTVAILAGDFLLAKASEVAAPLGEEAVALIARTYATLCEGQVLELTLENDLEHGPDEYFRVIGGKTASLIRTSARLGAMASGADREIIEHLSEWAWELGIVFQMTDDVLDLVASEEFLGKPAGSDIGEGVYTLPVLYAVQGPSGNRIRSLLANAGDHSPQAVNEVIDIVTRGGYIDQVLDEAAERIRVADKAASRLPEGMMREILRNIAAFLMERVSAARS